MTKWTPKLEKQIREYGDFEYEQLKELTDQTHTVVESALSMGFNAGAMGDIYKKVCKTAGLDPSWDVDAVIGNMQALVDLSKAQGSDAGNKLEKVVAFQKKALPLYAGHETDVAKNIEVVKASRLKLG